MTNPGLKKSADLHMQILLIIILIKHFFSESSRNEGAARFNGFFSSTAHTRCYELQECVREKLRILQNHNENTSRWTGPESKRLTTSSLMFTHTSVPTSNTSQHTNTNHKTSPRQQTARNQHCNYSSGTADTRIGLPGLCFSPHSL